MCLSFADTLFAKTEGRVLGILKHSAKVGFGDLSPFKSHHFEHEMKDGLNDRVLSQQN